MSSLDVRSKEECSGAFAEAALALVVRLLVEQILYELLLPLHLLRLPLHLLLLLLDDLLESCEGLPCI